MKKALIILFLSFTGSLFAQNAVYLSFSPCEMGIGIRYDRLIKNSGIYISANKGNYALDDSYIKDHYKYSLGFIHNNFSLGINYNKYGEIMGTFGNALRPVSFELGAKTDLNKLSVGIRFDPIKGEGSWDLGINFNGRNKYTNRED